MYKIYAHHTHYEVKNYNLGDKPFLEKMLSLWNDTYYKANPKFFYNEDNKTLYLPRGFSRAKIIEIFNEPINIMKNHSTKKKCSINMNLFPRNILQLESIRFITGKEEYRYTEEESQLVLSLGTGEGKTYCMIAALSIMETKSLIIVNIEDLKKQWINSFETTTNLGGPNIVDISSSKKIDKLFDTSQKELQNHVTYVTTHATIRNYAKKNGWESIGELCNHLGIGVKVIDEAHLEYENTLMMDYFTNVWKTIYLTATFGRSNEKDNKLFQTAFNEISKFNKINEERRKHIIYIPYLFNTKPSYNDEINCKGVKGFSRHAYMDYLMDNKIYIDNFKEAVATFLKKDDLEGKMLILSSKKETCDFFSNIIKDEYPDRKTCAHYSGSKVDDLGEYDVICATPKMLGTGKDIKGLRFVIMIEPFRSHVNSDQVIGRLREYSEDKDTYYLDLIDKGFKSIYNMYKDRYKASIQHKIKKCLIVDKTKKK